VGQGGAGSPASGTGAENGGSSSFAGITVGGGGAAGRWSTQEGQDAPTPNGGGGGGGGATSSDTHRAGGTGVLGGNGGNGATITYGGGGGGMGGNGQEGSSSGGQGGPGVQRSITGEAVWYAAGGNGRDGATKLPGSGAGSFGGGGHANADGGNGGSGIVILRYEGSQVLLFDESSNPAGIHSTYVDNDTGTTYQVHQFLDVGESAFTFIGTVEETFDNWISGFELEGGQTGFTEDYNNDGISNGMKYFFGVDPTEPSPGLSSLAVDVQDENKFSFTHPMADPPAPGVQAEYRWAKDLTEFHADGATDADGTTVTFVRGETVDGMVTVTATLEGTPTDRIFVALVVTQME
jgi:hypothetical protein